MKRIGVLSDTHGFLDERILNHFSECDEVWHAGDFGDLDVAEQLSGLAYLRGVYGNIDNDKVRITYPLLQKFKCENVSVWMTHIGGYPGNYDRMIKEELLTDHPGLFVCGHSHILKVVRDPKFNNMLCINPGAAGKNGLHKVRTIVRFSIDGFQIKNMQVVELGKR